MAVKIRLKRLGSKKRPFYRIVVADSRKAATKKDIEVVGHYNPIAQPKEISLDEELVMKWLHNGAKPSNTVRKILSEHGLMERYHNEKNNQ